MYHQSEQWKLKHYRYLYYTEQQDKHYKTASTQSGQFLVTEKSARPSSTRPHYFYCFSPDSRCADCRADTIGDTSIVSQSVTNNRCAPSCGGHKGKVGGGHIKKFSAGASIAPALCPPHLQIASDATEWRYTDCLYSLKGSRLFQTAFYPPVQQVVRSTTRWS